MNERTEALTPPCVQGENAPAVERYLVEGRLQAGEAALLDELKTRNHDDQLRFGLGILQFLQAFEKLMQDLNHYGVRNTFASGLNLVPTVSLPFKSNPEPQVLGYDQAQQIIATLLQNLAKAETTLATIADASVKLPLHVGMIRLDLDGDGQTDEEDCMWKRYVRFDPTRKIDLQTAEEFYISFDRGDVHWFRGYCHLLMASCEQYLAYDTREIFDCTAHLFFPNVESPYKFLLNKGTEVNLVNGIVGNIATVSDLLALIHLMIRLPVAVPERTKAALHHLEAVVAQSKESWKWIMAETDDDHAWIPNPRQTGVIPNVRVTEEMVNAWLKLMDQSGKVLAGELLIPFWRDDDDRGVNLRKFFLEPRTLDAVLWVQGTAAVPYLEKGEKIDAETWRRIQQPFGSQFPGFAIWFN